MSNTRNVWKLKFSISARSAAKVFKNPLYILMAIGGAIVSGGFILWSLNLDLVRYIVFKAPLSALEKLDFFFSAYIDIYSVYSGVQGTGIILFSILFGINLALLVFVLKHSGFKAIPKKSGIGGFLLAIIGGGCIVCGTSIVAPLIVTLGVTSVSFVRDLASVFNWLGSALIMYSIYKLGCVISFIHATK